jgi:hypothetical protein
MAEGRNIQGGVGKAGLRWWQKGSTEKKPTYFKGNAANTFFKQQQNLVNRAEKYYDKQFTLIKDRNAFFAVNKNIIKEPKYTFNEAMSLSKNGYTGLFGRSADKKTIGLMGEAWQQAYALDRLRKNKQMLSFGLYGDRKATLDYMAADVVAPGTKAYNKINSLIGEFNEYGGTAKYVGRYGSTPAIGSKYGLLFNTNNKAIRKDDVLATYQNSLVKAMANFTKTLTSPERNEVDKAIGVDQIKYQDYKIDLTSTRAKPSGLKIREMEQQLIWLQEAYAQPVQDAVGSPAPTPAERATTTALTALGGITGYAIGSTDTGNALANKAQTYMAGLAEHDVLKGRSIYKFGSDAPITQEGFVGLNINIVKGVARFGLGLPLGLTTAAGEGIMAAEETKKVLTGEKETWGEGVDFQLGDAIWADYASRYYDPFAYEVDENGAYVLDEAGERKFQGYWKGHLNKDNYDAFGEVFSKDPVAYALDVLDVVPAIGFVAKAASVASVAGKASRFGGKVGLTRADVQAAEAANARVVGIDVDKVASAQSIVDKINENPNLVDVLDESQIKEAAKIVADNTEAKEALDTAQAKVDMAPSPRKFRRITRAAINGDANARTLVDTWRSMGLEFNGAENSWSVRFSAQFEPRTKVLDAPASILNPSDKAIVRLPASPLIRGIKEGWSWVGRAVEKTAQERVLSTGDASSLSFKIATKFIDMPRFGYRWNYTRAIQNELVYDWGDTTSEMKRAADILNIDGASTISAPLRQAVEAEIFGGTGSLGPAARPAVQRQGIRDKLKSLPRDKATGDFRPAVRNDAATLQKKLNDLLDQDLAKVDEGAAAVRFDEQFDTSVTDLRARIADDTYKAGDPELDAALELYRRMMRQDEAIRHRLKHEDMSPTTLSHLRMLYEEAMLGLRLNKTNLFGKNGKTGRLGKYTKRVLRPNNALAMYLTRLVDVNDDAAIIDAAQNADKIGTVFDDLEPSVRKEREQDLIDAVRVLVEDNAGIFRDGQGGAGDIGRPIMVLAADGFSIPGFVKFHLPRLRHSVNNGKVVNGKLVDEGEVFILPKQFFASKKKVETPEDASTLLETGVLNAMADIYPNARFYSEKIAETGRAGIRLNEKQIKTEHTIANTALREHSIAQAVRSQVNYFVGKVMIDIANLAESQAVLVPAINVVGKTAKESGYQVLDAVRTFDNIDDARDFAKLRGVTKEFEEAVELYEQGLLTAVTNTIDVAAGMGIRNLADGTTEFIVRGGVEDWTPYAINESLIRHSALEAFRGTQYADPIDIPDHGFVLAVPNQVDKQLSLLAISGDDFASRLLSNPLAKGPVNIFKWLVLNANPKFISNNVIGGLTMLMIYNPGAAVNILTRAMQQVARKGGDPYLSNVVNESRAVRRQLEYEFNHNIYRQDAGVRQNMPKNILDLANKHEWVRKYLVNFGYTTVSTFEQFIRNNVAIDFLKQDAGFEAFMDSAAVRDYVKRNVDYDGNPRPPEDPISRFEAATDLLLDRNSQYFDAQLKHRMRYATNTVSGNYHRFGPTEQLMRNFLMPFYAWQRHSATFTYRLAIDKPITANVLYNVGQFGYVQAAESGVPDYMMMTVPLPQVLKEKLGIEDEDFRVDANALTPFSTTGDMASAATRLLTGVDLGNSVFEFSNPYFNAIVKDTLGVDPLTGRYDFTGEQSGKGLIGAVSGMGTGIVKGTYIGRGKGVYDAIENGYAEDSLANKYRTIDNAPDILKNYDAGEKFSDYRLSIPEMSKSEREGSVPGTILNLLGVKTYRVNLDAMDEGTRGEAVGAAVLNAANEGLNTSAATKTLNGVKEWQRRRDYVMQVWLPVAEDQGVAPETIRLVLAKIEDEKPDSAKSQKILALLGG